ncbi:patatin-like phospholipase family protein [Algoriphagus taiwanensis]
MLSGGGAKGMAHIGVLRAMEKAGIRPDYIVGTSMGSVVGGLYAMGYNADELEQIIRSIDWDLIISNRVGFETIAFEEKEYYNRYLIELPLVNGKVSLPSGLIEGQMLSEVLHYFTWPANQFSDFDDLPIPFRCIATDVSTGEPVVFSKGYLHDALRSSIAIPTAFTAFQLDSTIVVDGGVVNNFPVDVAKEMGAEFIIGVNVSDEDFIDSKKLEGFGAILMQLSMAKSLAKTRENIEQTDIYIKPDLGPYSTGSFGSFDKILRLGDETGEKFLPLFQRLADSLQLDSPSPGIGMEAMSSKIRRIEVQGNSIFPSSLILSKLGIKSGESVTRDMVEEGIQRVFGINGFYKVDYSMRWLGENTYDLIIRVKEKSSKLFSFAFHYDNQFSAGILLNFTARDFIGKSSRTVFVGDVSANPKFRVDHYKYIGREKKFALNARYNFLNQELPEYEGGREVNINVERNQRAELQLISTSSLKEAWYVGGVFETSSSKVRLNPTVPEDIKNAFQSHLGFRVRYYRNSQNDRNFPTRGAEGLIEGTFNFKNWVGINLRAGVDSVFFNFDGVQVGFPESFVDLLAESLTPDPYLSMYGRYSKLLPLSRRFQVQPIVAGSITLSNNEGVKSFQEFYLGGYQNIRFNDTRFWGLNYAEVTTSNFLKLGLDVQFIPLNKIFVRAGINSVGFSDADPISDGKWADEIFQDEVYFGYGADISYQSILGPISFGISSNTTDKRFRSYFSLGFSLNQTDR